MSFGMPPATPQRPTPGAFVNTPAPTRPGLFRTASSSAQQTAAPAAPPQPALPSLTPIERAARTVNTFLDKDAGFRELETHLVQGVSGEYEIARSSAWTPFEEIKTYRIPDRILEQINMTQMATSMGLFAEINHAWVAIDNQLYLWDYTSPNPDLIGFEEQPHTIVSVKLVRPRAGVFVAGISYLLVVATAADVFLIAMQCERGPEGVHSVTLFRTGLATTVKGISVNAIAGSSASGRIFFADGRDSEDVYELNYNQEERWFHHKCSKTNHTQKSILPALPFYGASKQAYVIQLEVDDTRNVLYALSSNGTIRVFHMKTPTTLDCVITTSLARLRAMCTHIVPHRADAMGGNDMEIVGIDTISATEANSVSLIATTSTGCRIFISTTTGGYYSETTAAPTSMQVRHIRFPPLDTPPASQPPTSQLQPYQAAAPVGYDSKYLTATVSTHRYAPGSTFFNIRKNQDRHALFLTAPHMGQSGSSLDPSQNPRYIEDAQLLELSGFMQDIGLVTPPFAAASRPLGFGNESAVQFDRLSAEFAVMTHTGIQTLRRRRLVDIFAAIIKHGGGLDGVEGELRRFLSRYDRRETEATALAVACHQATDVGADLRVAQISDPDVTEYARKAFLEFGGKAQLNENATVEGLNVDNVTPSPRHDGIAIYVSRLVRSIWKSPILKLAKTPTGQVPQAAQSTAKLRDVQNALVKLQSFLEDNKQNIDGLAGPEALGRVTSRQEEVELQGENRALTSLLELINNMIEGIAFVLVMFEDNLAEIIALLPPESQQKVMQLTFEALFAVQEGKHLARDLVKAIVNYNIKKGANVEQVAEALRRKCGSFCSSDDVVIFKAQEYLKKATDAGLGFERSRHMLNDSLKLFEQVAKSLTQDNLTQAVDQYIAQEFYAGAIRLALKRAQELDRANKALSWIKDDRPLPDARESAYKARTQCYDLAFSVIEAVDQVSASQGNMQDGVISPIARRRQEAYDVINDSDDEVFQNYLYDWYIQQGWPERLLEIQSPFVVDYLQRSSATDLARADLLWRYYAHYNEFLNAAEVQFQLAKSEFALSLEKRIEYLSRAKANASTRMTGFSDIGLGNRQSRQELIRSISDHLDIANIQDDVVQRIKAEKRLSAAKREEVLARLDGRIQPLDDLFHDFADQAGYYDICLLIFHAADYRNLADVRSTWTNYIDQLHKEAVEENQQAPWERIAHNVERIGHRVGLNENVFPVNLLLQALLQYDLATYTHDSMPSRRGSNNLNADANLIPCASITWPLDIFIRVGAPFEILVATLEALWYAHEHPFQGRNRRMLVKWMIYTVEQWGQASNRQGPPFGGEENAIGLAECLQAIVLSSNELDRNSREDVMWLERGRSVREAVEAAAA